jgi:hypothetical protein
MPFFCPRCRVVMTAGQQQKWPFLTTLRLWSSICPPSPVLREEREVQCGDLFWSRSPHPVFQAMTSAWGSNTDLATVGLYDLGQVI